MSKWKIDPVHSEIAFKVKHLMISTIRGTFDNFEGSITTKDSSFNNSEIAFYAEVNSINTKFKQRDSHLLGPDFFDADKFPRISFVSTNVLQKNEKELEITGDLTIKDVTKSVQLNATVNGTTKATDGSIVTGFHLHGEINRKDFGIVWNVPLEAGGVLIDETVTIEAFIEVKE